MMKMALSFLALLLLNSWTYAATVGTEFVLPASPLPAHDPCVANGDGKYLVVWQSGKAEKADLYACRLDEQGKPLETKPFCVSNAFECQERPRAAWGKNSWLVVWADLRNDRNYDIYAARVASDGTVLDPEGIPIAALEHNQAQPDVAFNGKDWLVAWRSFDKGKYAGRGARVTLDGKLLDQEPIEVAEEADDGMSVGEVRVCAIGEKWLASWITKSIRPVGAFGMSSLNVAVATPDGKFNSSRVSRGDGSLIAPVTAASNGKDACLLSWWNCSTGGRGGPQRGLPYGAIRVGVNGKSLGSTELGGQKVEIKQPAAAWDGKGYLVVAWDGHAASSTRPHVNRIVAHQVGEEGKYEGQIEVASGEPHPGYSPAACGNGAGACLVVYERHPAKDDETILIAARLLRR
jgi:hypothetical protein